MDYYNIANYNRKPIITDVSCAIISLYSMACINDQPRLLLSLAGLHTRYACEYEVIIIYSLLLKMIMSLHVSDYWDMLL